MNSIDKTAKILHYARDQRMKTVKEILLPLGQWPEEFIGERRMTGFSYWQVSVGQTENIFLNEKKSKLTTRIHQELFARMSALKWADSAVLIYMQQKEQPFYLHNDYQIPNATLTFFLGGYFDAPRITIEACHLCYTEMIDMPQVTLGSDIMGRIQLMGLSKRERGILTSFVSQFLEKFHFANWELGTNIDQGHWDTLEESNEACQAKIK